MAYRKTTWVNDRSPSINATNLNHIEDGLSNAYDIISTLRNFTYEAVNSLPAASAETMNKIYLVPAAGGGNAKDEYITIEHDGTYSWLLIGSTSINLSDYYTKVQTDSLFQNYHDSTKQDKLTAGSNITIQNNVISAQSQIDMVWGNISGTLANQTDLQDALDEKYTEPEDGIPRTDLTTDVQSSLNAADTAIQAHQNIKELTTMTAVPQGGFYIGVAEAPSGENKKMTNAVLRTGLNIPTATNVLTNNGADGTNPYVTQQDINNSISGLDGVITGEPAASKTLATLSETDGKVKASFQDISIGPAQVKNSDNVTLQSIAFSADYNDLRNTPSTINWNNIIGKPNIPEAKLTSSGKYAAQGVAIYDISDVSGPNVSGDIRFVVTSSEPTTKYDGYFYIVTE